MSEALAPEAAALLSVFSERVSAAASTPPAAAVWMPRDPGAVPTPIPYLSGGLLVGNAVNLISGDPGSGKSLAALVMAGEAMADDPDLHVVLALPEDGPNDLLTRLHANDLEHLWNDTRFHVLIGGASNVDGLVQILRDGLGSGLLGTGDVLCVVDTPARLFEQGQSANGYTDTYDVFGKQAEACMNEPRLTFVNVWHNNKSGGYMGSTAVSGAVRNMLSCAVSVSGTHVIETTKRNNGSAALRSFTIADQPLSFAGVSGPRLTWVMTGIGTDPILDAMQNQPPMTRVELEVATGLASATLRRRITALIAKRLLVQDGKRGNAPLYRLPSGIDMFEAPDTSAYDIEDEDN